MDSYKNRINNYKLLCGIIPYYKKTKYPYSHWTEKKITKTGKIINIKEKKKGGSKVTVWVF